MMNVHAPAAPRHRLRPWLAATLASCTLVLLASCGPASSGSGASYAYTRGATYPVRAGEAISVDLTLSLADLGLDEETADESATTWIPAGLRGESTNASSFILFRDVEVSEGWEARLWQIRVVRARPFNDPAGDLTYSVDATIRVDVPADAYELTRRVSGTLVPRDGGGAFPVSFLVEAF
jgi:hypothetical protein